MFTTLLLTPNSSARRQLITVITLSCLFLTQLVAVVPAQRSSKQKPPPGFANPTSTIFINEILYDIVSTDAGEFVEVAGPAGTNLTGWSIVLYNGSGGASYDTDALSGTIPSQQGGYGTVSISYPSNGIQNGAPDGLALVNASSIVIQFLCYEGAFTATNGPANGLTCTDIGVSQDGSNAAGTSLQLQGTGTTYGNFTWNATSLANTQNAPNTGQTFTGGGGATLNINDVTQTEGDAGTSTFDFTVSLTQPAGVGGVSFTVNTADGTTNPANAGSDYAAIVNGPGSILEGNSSTSVSVTVNGDVSPEPNETFFVNLTNVTGATPGDVQGLGTITNDEVTITTICQIQGSGTTSPIPNGTNVTTTGIVTGIKQGSSGGFFIQQPGCDSETETSDGIFVFTGASVPAGVVIGNNVQVSGNVLEFIPSADPNQNPVTELSGGPVTVNVISTGNPIPGPHVLTASDTTDPSETTDPLDTLEEYEGMRVTVEDMLVVAPTQGFIDENDATSTSNGLFFGVVLGVLRPFREPGIAISDPVPAPNPPNVPRFDENPERLRVDSDSQPGTTAIDAPAGTIISGITGPLDYSFRTYTILPEAASPPLVGVTPTFTPVPPPNADELTVASFNAFHFFDTNDDPGVSDVVLTPAAFNNRLNKISLVIRNVMMTPDVIGVQEFDNLGTLQAVANKVNTDAGTPGDYVAFLEEGNDIGGIDVGFLVRSSRVDVVSVTQEGLNATFINPNTGLPETLNDRPPLVLQATIDQPSGGSLAFTVIVSHLRSLIDVEGDNDPGRRARAKRQAGAEFLANLIQTRQTADPNEPIISVGDMNAFQFNDGFGDVIGTIKGTPSPDDQTVVPGDGADLVDPDLTDLVDTLNPDQQYSFTFDGSAQVLDHILVNDDALAIKTRFAYARNNADFPTIYYGDSLRPERISDHDMPVAYFSLGPQQPQGSVIISEFRFHGPDPGGEESPRGLSDPAASNEFIEIYNNTDSDIQVSTTDKSSGWAVVASDGLTVFEIPNGTIIPARGHYLGTNIDGYSLDHYGGFLGGAGDSIYSGDLDPVGGIALFRTSNPLNFTLSERLDAVGYEGVDQLYREGSGLPLGGPETQTPVAEEFSFFRDMRTTSAFPKDTGDNAADFLLASADSFGGGGPLLGAPGPENLFSPINRNSSFNFALLDPNVAGSVSPNRERKQCPDAEECDPNRSQFGTMSVRRTYTNNTGNTVLKLRFRIIDITTLPPPNVATADVRAISSSDISVLVDGSPVDVRGTTLEEPPFQQLGGGWNSSLDVDFVLNNSLPPGESVSVQFLLGVQQRGNFRFFISIEAVENSPFRPVRRRGN